MYKDLLEKFLVLFATAFILEYLSVENDSAFLQKPFSLIRIFQRIMWLNKTERIVGRDREEKREIERGREIERADGYRGGEIDS